MSDGSDAPESPPPHAPRKDRLIQTRVPRELEQTLKQEAKRRRLTVSHLIRNILEDTLDLVDDVVGDIDQLVTDSVTLARNVGRNARRLASPDRDVRGESESDLADVYGWNEVVLQKAVTCSRCGAGIERGQKGFAGLREDPGPPRAWLCQDCVEAL